MSENKHSSDNLEPPSHKAALVGNPNVGKSLLFNRLTGRYVTVSNYPGTTVEVSRGSCLIDGYRWEIVDTPGMYSFASITEEERVARDLLIDEQADVVIHVVDAKNLERQMPLTLQLIEAGLRVILVLNLMDEAVKLGLTIDSAALSRKLGIPVIEAAFIKNKGIKSLKQQLIEMAHHAD